jgi:outer membrane protein
MKYWRILALLFCIAFISYGSPGATESGSAYSNQTGGTMTISSSNTTTVPLPAAVSQTSTAGVLQGPQAGAALAMPIAAGTELTLKQAIAISLEYHPRIREAVENLNAATARVGEARSYLGPQALVVGQDMGSTDNGIGNASYYNPGGVFPRMTGRNHDLPSNDFSQSWNTSNNYMGGLAVSQFLFDFGRRHGFVTQRKDEAASVSAAEQLAKLDLIFEVSQRYFAVLQAQQLIKVYEKALEQREYHFHEAQVKANAGLRPQLDVYVTQAEVERAQLHLVDARNSYGDAKVALNNALGLSERAPEYHLADILTYSPMTETVQPLIATALQRRPDLHELEDQAKALGAQVVQYKSDNFPTVSALGGYSAVGTGLPAANNFNIGVVITWPIFNSFLTTDQIAETKAQQRSVQYAIEDLQQRIILQVQTAFLDSQASLQRIERAQKALAASRAELELAEKRYEAGLANIVELEDAQRYYTYDDAEYASSLYGFAVAKAAVAQATARSL